MTKCEKCELLYNVCRKCGTSHFLGSSSAEHYMNCSLGEGVFEPNDGENYPPWEAPNGNCPNCWHKENIDKELIIVQDWLLEKIRERIQKYEKMVRPYSRLDNSL
jgi:hypothetical protein